MIENVLTVANFQKSQGLTNDVRIVDDTAVTQIASFVVERGA